MSLTNGEITNLLYNVKGTIYRVIGDKLREYRKTHLLEEYQCCYCRRHTPNIGAFFCQDLNVDPDVDCCAEKFYQENQDILLEIITE